MKRLFLYFAKALGLFALSRLATRGQLRLLCYHGIWLGGDPHYGDCLYMSRQRFAQRVGLLARQGYPVLPLQDALERLRNGTLPDCAVAITIDDAWYGTYLHMLPVLRQHRMPATVYVTTYYVMARRPVLNVLIGCMVTRARALPEPERLLSR
ncbi:MAG TPA: polysaccharide deacetylase family protein [Burkholderiales bacterium]|nr:polysaccharide deacetylase family protein [Burkholderiales bacterium]